MYIRGFTQSRLVVGDWSIYFVVAYVSYLLFILFSCLQLVDCMFKMFSSAINHLCTYHLVIIYYPYCHLIAMGAVVIVDFCFTLALMKTTTSVSGTSPRRGRTSFMTCVSWILTIPIISRGPYRSANRSQKRITRRSIWRCASRISINSLPFNSH